MKINFCCLRLSSSVTQPHSLYRLSIETDLVKPVTIGAASFCIFCNEFISCIVQPSQTTYEYSKTGKIYDKNIWFNAVRLKVNLSYRIIPKTLDALEIILSIWLCNWPLLLRVRPKCLCSLTNFIGVLSKVILGRLSNSLRVKTIASVFSGLKFINHCAAHLTKIRRSWFIIPSISTILVAE